MAKYRVIEGFYDLQDPIGRNNYHLYNKDDEYPRAGMEPAPERVAFLLSESNNRGTPLIEEIHEEPAQEPEEAPKPKKRRAKAEE